MADALPDGIHVIDDVHADTPLAHAAWTMLGRHHADPDVPDNCKPGHSLTGCTVLLDVKAGDPVGYVALADHDRTGKPHMVVNGRVADGSQGQGVAVALLKAARERFPSLRHVQGPLEKGAQTLFGKYAPELEVRHLGPH